MSPEKLKTLSASGGSYIVCTPMRLGDAVTTAVLTRAGRFKRLRDNLEVKEVWVPPSGAARRRYVVCRNPVEAERARKKREDILVGLERELAASGRSEEAHPKKACDPVAANQYRPCLKGESGPARGPSRRNG